MFNKDHLSLIESKALEGERGQPIGACLPFYTPHSLFFLVFPFFFFSSFSFSMFTYLLQLSLRGCYYCVRDCDGDPPLCAQ